MMAIATLASLGLAAALSAMSSLSGRSGEAATSARVDALPVVGPHAVRVNGELSDDVWSAATAVDAFRQREPSEGSDPSQRTEFRVAYDATTLYVKVRAFDSEPERSSPT